MLIFSLIFFRKNTLIKEYKKGLIIVLLAAAIIPSVVGTLKAVTNTPCPNNINYFEGEYPNLKVFDLYPKDFPDYRRSPRLNLKVSEQTFKLDALTKDNSKDKNGLMKMLLPPLGMVAMTGVTTVLSGRNPAMMLGMGGMSLMTAGVTVSQYVTDKKEKKKSSSK